jgi:hypothetical protein
MAWLEIELQSSPTVCIFHVTCDIHTLADAISSTWGIPIARGPGWSRLYRIPLCISPGQRGLPLVYASGY